MSGGVDSSVAAYILKEQGYEVIGVTMQVWQDGQGETPEGACCGLTAAEDARRVAEQLDIPHYVLNFKDIFKNRVVDYFVNEYLCGRTPNPCIACNRYVKWEALLDKAMALEAEYIATGHYAEITRYPLTGRLCLKAVDSPKDQTYALYGLTQFQLEHTLMSLAGMGKDEVRGLAAELGLCVAQKPDSQEICFIPDNNHGKFIEEYTRSPAKPGDFVDAEGRKLGEHEGVARYTIGQRKGLGIALGKPVFVKAIDPVANTVTLAGNEELYSRELVVRDVNYMAISGIDGELSAMCKIRYGQKMASCTLESRSEGGLRCVFDEPQRAVTPGQAAVFYDAGHVLCGGTII